MGVQDDALAAAHAPCHVPHRPATPLNYRQDAALWPSSVQMEEGELPLDRDAEAAAALLSAELAPVAQMGAAEQRQQELPCIRIKQEPNQDSETQQAQQAQQAQQQLARLGRCSEGGPPPFKRPRWAEAAQQQDTQQQEQRMLDLRQQGRQQTLPGQQQPTPPRSAQAGPQQQRQSPAQVEGNESLRQLLMEWGPPGQPGQAEEASSDRLITRAVQAASVRFAATGKAVRPSQAYRVMPRLLSIGI